MLRLGSICLLAACGSKSVAPPGPPVDAVLSTGYGGAIVLFAEPDGFGVVAELYDRVTPDGVPSLHFGDGHCELAAPISLSAIDRDLGPSLSLTTTDAMLVAPSTPTHTFGLAEYLMPTVPHSGIPVLYEATSTTIVGFSRTWTIAAGDQTLATIALPGPVTQGDSLFPYTPHTPTTVQFGGGLGADYIELRVEAAGGTANCYPPPGATSFAIPGDVLDQVAGTEHLVGVAVFAKTRALVPIGGRAVVVTGVAQNLD
jgi:hypothetical protein